MLVVILRRACDDPASLGCLTLWSEVEGRARTFLTSWAKSAQSRGGSLSSGRVQESSVEPWPTIRMTPAGRKNSSRSKQAQGAPLLDWRSPQFLG